MKPTRTKPSGLLAVALGITTAAASLWLLPENMQAFAQNYPQPNAQVPVASQPVANQQMAQNPVAVMPQQAAPVANPSVLIQENRRLMLAARTALAGGDVQTAEQQMQQAAALKVPYTQYCDRPDYFWPLIAGYKNWQMTLKTQGDTEPARRMRADNLALQAEGFYRHNNYDMAEKLAKDAIAQNVNVSANLVNEQRDPQTTLRRIADYRLIRESERNVQVASNVPISGAVLQQAQEMQPALELARQHLQAGQVAEAENIARQLQARNVPDGAFASIGDNPNQLVLDIAKTRYQMTQPGIGVIQPAVLTPGLYPTNAVQVQGVLNPVPMPGQMPTMAPADRTPATNVADMSRLASEQEFSNEVARQITRSQQLMSEEYPRMDDAINNLRDVRAKIIAAEISSDMKRTLGFKVDRELAQMEDFRAKHGSAIEIARDNAQVYADIEEQRRERSYVEMKLKEYVDEYYELYRKERYTEAAAVAEKARAIDPKNPVVEQMDFQSMMAGRQQEHDELRNQKEFGIYTAWTDQIRSSIANVSDSRPLVGSLSTWNIAKNRPDVAVMGDVKTDAEKRIYDALGKNITLNTNGPQSLRAVVEKLMSETGINIHVDEQALSEINTLPGSDLTVSLDNRYGIMLKSALNLMLHPVGLSYTVRDESLVITTPAHTRPELKAKAYYIGDLAMRPVSTRKVRMKTPMERYKEALEATLGRSTGFGVNNGSSPMNPTFQQVSFPMNAWNNPTAASQIPTNINPQTMDGSYYPGGYGNNYGGGYGYDPFGAAGGGAGMGELMMLIQQLVDPESWMGGGMGMMGGIGGSRGNQGMPPGGGLDPTGTGTTGQMGYGTIMPYTNSMTFIIRQTEENHQQIADLLKQLRKMNDIQITVEVRFISITDDFFETIGVDFDVNLRKKNGNLPPGYDPYDTDTAQDPRYAEAVKSSNNKGFFGLVRSGSTYAPGFSPDLGFSMNQGSNNLATPQFGNFDAAAGTSIGFAILSDIETYFFMNAAQGDSRSNVLQAPKVTVWNGMTASVMSETQRPFVVSAVPIVGDFSVAYQPVIEMFGDTVQLDVEATVSSDRRYVRLNLQPNFTYIDKVVPTYNFSSQTTTANQSAATPIVMQQPIESTFNVTTSVSVPDGGTILMGGVKRLSEGRKEYGVPMINKIPYLKRLFSNTAVGRETSSMMIMVTPHIIIQEEYERSMETATN